jgi:PAS domain S-box-containing protein
VDERSTEGAERDGPPRGSAPDRSFHVRATSMVGLISWERGGGVLDANDVFLELVGYTREDLNAGRISWIEMTPPEYRAHDAIALAEVAEHRACKPFEKEFIRKDGTRVCVLIGGELSPGSEDRGISFVVDVTDRKRSERELRESEARFRALTEAQLRSSDEAFRLVTRATNDAIYDWDMRADVLLWNECIQTLTGFAAEEIGEQLAWWTDKLHPDDRDRVGASLQAKVDDGQELWSEEYRFRRSDGSYAEIFDRGLIVRDAAGRAQRMIGAMMDITERKQMAERLRLADRMASVGTLAAGVAHEINNPLAFVTTNLEFALRHLAAVPDPTPDLLEARRALEDASEGAKRVRHIVRDLRTFSRADEEQRGPVDVRRVLESCISMTSNEVRHRAKLVRDFRDVPPVIANEARLAQVFLNLLVNAAQSLPDGQADRHEIRIVTRVGAGRRVIVEVRDTGPGMSAAVRARIFDPFFTTKRVGEGTGLGLSICHGIITALGGEIRLDSQPDRGTVATVDLPAASEAPNPVPPVAESESDADADVGRRRGKVLIIDDEPMVAKALERSVELEHDVRTVASARQALALLAEGSTFDVILCDLMMPEMTGMDFFDELAVAAPEHRDRVVFLTGGAFTGRARDFLRLNGNPRLEKPFGAQVLLNLVRSVMGAPPSSPGGKTLP